MSPQVQYEAVMKDGAPAHKAEYTQAWRSRLGIVQLDWCSLSPDLNPIENVWYSIKTRLKKRQDRPTTAPSVRQAVQEEWDAVTAYQLLNLEDSIPVRVEAVIQAEGGHTRW